MAEQTINARVKMRIDTAANWASVNPVLLAGEQGVESDTRFSKTGDGSTAWNDLEYNTSPEADIAGNYVLRADADFDADGKGTTEEISKSDYTLPAATKATLGGVIVGDGLEVSDAGKVAVAVGDGLDVADNKIIRTDYLQPNTAYAVGDIVRAEGLASYLRLECTTAGTTGDTLPDFSTVKSGGVTSWGTAEFTAVTVTSTEETTKKCKELLNGLLLTKMFTVSVSATSNPVCYVSADDVDGYSFLCWINFTSNGTVWPVHSDLNFQQKNARIWCSDVSKINGYKVDGWALYVKNP